MCFKNILILAISSNSWPLQSFIKIKDCAVKNVLPLSLNDMVLRTTLLVWYFVVGLALPEMNFGLHTKSTKPCDADVRSI